MGAHLPQDNCRRPLRREYPTRGILHLPDQESNPISLHQKSWPWVEVLVWVGLKALQGGGIGTGVVRGRNIQEVQVTDPFLMPR